MNTAPADDLTSLRLTLHHNAYHPVPVLGPHVATKAAGKRPVMKSWEAVCATADAAEITRWTNAQRNCTNTGLLCGTLIGVDIDVLDAHKAEHLTALACNMLAVGAAPAQADGPLSEFLASAPLFDALFLNLASNNATLLGHIEADLNAPCIPHQSGFATAGGTTVMDPLGRPAPLPNSTISRLATSATGAMQEGKIAVTTTTLAPVFLTSQWGMSGGPATIHPEPKLTSPGVSITAENSGLNMGSVGSAIAVRGQNQTLDVPDLSTSATGAISTGQISIVVSNN